MIADRNDAFRHNACKKLAQLSKVIFQMSKAKLERCEEINNLIYKYESMIGQLVKQHQKSIEEIAKGLVVFRKRCIDSECQHYALQYKVTKSTLTDLYNEKFQILQSIGKEGEIALSNVQNIQKNSINESNNCIQYANQVQTKIANYAKKSQATIDKKAEKSIQPILEKIANLKKENEARMKQILTQHAQNIRENRTEIYKILKQELILRKDDLISYQTKLKSLKADINTLSKEYEQTKKNQEKFYSDLQNKRNFIITSTNNSCTETNNKISSLMNKEKNNESERKFQIQELNKVKQTLFNSHQSELNNLISQIQYQKHQIEQFETSKAAEIEKRKFSIENLTNSIKKEFENNLKNRNGTFSEVENILSQSSKDITSVRNHFQSIIDDSKSKTKNKNESFQIQIGKEIQSITITFEKQLNNFKDAARNRVIILTNSLKSQDNLNHERQKEIQNEIHQLLNQLKKLQGQIEIEIEEKKKKNENDMNEYQKANIARQQNRKKEIEMIMNRKRNEKEKQFSTFKEKLQIELKEKKNKIESENELKLIEFNKQNESSILDLTKEENEHQSMMLKMKGKLNFATDEFERSKKYCEQRLAALQNEIQNSEKMIRQIQRKIKTETQAINEEYEMKIQVEQVKLNNAIENISKLYEKDENLRGVEIIEAIRKLRDMKNRSFDLQVKKKHEIENDEKNFQKKKIEIQNEIENLKEQTRKNELNDKLKSLIEKSNQELKIIEDDSNSKLNNLNEMTVKIKEEQTKNIKNVKIQIDKENADFQSKVDELKSKEIEIKNKTDEQISIYEKEYEMKKKELNDKYQDQVSKLKNRIESAKKVQKEVIDSTTKDYDTAIKNEEDLIIRKCSDDQEALKKLSQDFIQKNAELALKTKDLLVKVSHLHINQIISPIRKTEETKLNSLKDELNTKNTELQNLFDTSLKTLENLKLSQKTSSQQQQPMQFKVGSNNSKRSTRKNNKNEYPKMYETPKKILPAIMTPQLV